MKGSINLKLRAMRRKWAELVEEGKTEEADEVLDAIQELKKEAAYEDQHR